MFRKKKKDEVEEALKRNEIEKFDRILREVN